jgi:hypothetical protein
MGKFKKGDKKPAGSGIKKGQRRQAWRDITEVISTIRDASTPEMVEDGVRRLWAKKPEAMVAFFGRFAPRDLVLRDGRAEPGAALDMSKLTTEEVIQLAELKRKARADKALPAGDGSGG